MTLTVGQIALYAGALLVLFLTPGPVWLAMTARALSAGFRGAWPLALGVVVGDVVWPLLAIAGVGLLAGYHAVMLDVLRYLGAAIFVWMGAALIRHRAREIGADSALTRPGAWAGFAAGLLAILGNPKAILFYMGVLPGFFDLSAVTAADVAAICAVSAGVPLIGNLALAAFLGRVRAILASPRARARLNAGAGAALIAAGVAIALT